MAVLNRKKFIQYAEDHWKKVIYTVTDCQQFVEDAAKAAGYTFNSSGSNDMWRNYLKKKGDTINFDLNPGDVLFEYYNPGDKNYNLPSRYAGHSEKRDIHHVGILTAIEDGKYIVCHSAGTKSNGKRDVYNSKAALAKIWQLAGILKNTNTWSDENTTLITIAPTPVADIEKIIWDFFISKGLNQFAVAGLMGNLYAESNLSPIALSKKGISADSYFTTFDTGKCNYKDGTAMGLAQWCYWSRKQSLFNYCQKQKLSSRDIKAQLGFLWEELQTYKTVIKVLQNATGIKEASDIILTGFEKPNNQSEAVKSLRERYGQVYYDKFTSSLPQNPISNITVICDQLRYRAQPNLKGTILGHLTNKKTYSISKIENDWGYIPALNGWCSLDSRYVKMNT